MPMMTKAATPLRMPRYLTPKTTWYRKRAMRQLSPMLASPKNVRNTAERPEINISQELVKNVQPSDWQERAQTSCTHGRNWNQEQVILYQKRRWGHRRARWCRLRWWQPASCHCGRCVGPRRQTALSPRTAPSPGWDDRSRHQTSRFSCSNCNKRAVIFSWPGRLLGQDVCILDHKVFEAGSLLVSSVLQRVVGRQRSPEVDLTTQERGGEVLGGETLIHVPVELWVGDGQTQRTWKRMHGKSAPLGGPQQGSHYDQKPPSLLGTHLVYQQGLGPCHHSISSLPSHWGTGKTEASWAGSSRTVPEEDPSASPEASSRTDGTVGAAWADAPRGESSAGALGWRCCDRPSLEPQTPARSSTEPGSACSNWEQTCASWWVATWNFHPATSLPPPRLCDLSSCASPFPPDPNEALSFHLLLPSSDHLLHLKAHSEE